MQGMIDEIAQALPPHPCYLSRGAKGEFTTIDKAQISVMDRGFIFGDGVYEVCTVYDGKPFRFAQHMARLDRSLRELRIPNPHTQAHWLDLVQQLITINSIALGADNTPATGHFSSKNWLIYLQITRGVALRDHAMPKEITPTIFMMRSPLPMPSAQARSQMPELKSLRYGDAPRALIDYFPAPSNANAKPPGLMVFIHGGYWQELSKDESSFLAPAWHAAGFAHAAIGYTLAPQASLAEIVAQCKAALAYLGDHAARLHHDAQRIVVAGSSAGAYLAAACAADPSLSIAGIAAISGIYDLRPLVGTSINQALQLTMQDAARLSAMTAASARVPAVIAWGEMETAAFKQQSGSLAEHFKSMGQNCTAIEIPSRNHFDVVHELGDASSAVFKAALKLFDRSAAKKQ